MDSAARSRAAGSSSTGAAPASASDQTASFLSESKAPASAAASTSTVSEKSDTRLYVGNLHPGVDEYSLIQVFSKYGKIAKLDFLFHKAGPQKGKPRGYAFVEFSKKEEAMQALVATNDKLLRGRKLSVTFANKSEHADLPGGLGPHRHRHGETNKPTTLSLIKNAQKPKSTNAKIAAMEAKLKLLQEQRSSGSASPRGDDSSLPKPPPSAGVPSKPPPAFNRGGGGYPTR